jgi:N-acetylglutamate synthase-like GNAT family acetyltransferase
MLIRESSDSDREEILAIINEAAHAYRGIIPDDRWHEPYMPQQEFENEIASGVNFWIAEENGQILGVIGLQDKGDVALVRHAYVSAKAQRKGVGTRLLHYVEQLTDKPILIGTWADASWAIDFYERNGYSLVDSAEKTRLLKTYWSIPDRQIETSVVLAGNQRST